MHIYIEVRESTQVEPQFNKATNTLSLVRDGKPVVSFNNEIIDSGALAGHLPQGQVVLPLNNESFSGVHRTLEKRGVVELLERTWSTYGGLRYVAARVLI